MSELPEFRAWAAAARPRLRRTAFLLTGDWRRAEALVQETLVQMVGVRGRTARPDARARRILVSRYRTTRGRAPGPDQGPDEPGQQDELLTALAGLDPSLRAIVVLRYWENLTVDDVADLLDLPPSTVRARASRALLVLQDRRPTPSSRITHG
jgi:RNA polymerase sigma factor (sigma-70 family)